VEDIPSDSLASGRHGRLDLGIPPRVWLADLIAPERGGGKLALPQTPRWNAACGAGSKTGDGHPDPQAQQIMRNLVNTPQGVALLIGMGLFFAMVVFLVFTAISGAVAASTLGSKNP
jgi:hypothetical protein